MNNIPINRWTVGIALAVVALLSGDFISFVKQAALVFASSGVPAY